MGRLLRLVQVPRFHLNILNGDGEAPDEEGEDDAGLAAARAEAVRGIDPCLPTKWAMVSSICASRSRRLW
jgi:hypothetical protein